MKDPAFLFYSSDFLSGVQDLTMEERGQYITLLCLQHQKGHLTEKMIRLCCGNAAADVMAKFRQDHEGFFFNERLEIEVAKRKAHTEKQRVRAIDGWKKRKNQNSDTDATASTTANATALPLENRNENENENKDVIKKTARKKFVKPDENDVYNLMGELNAVGKNFMSEDKLVNFARIFMDHYEANGWIVGKTPMKDWHSTVKNWMRREWDKVKNQKPKNVIQNEREKRASELEQFRKQYRSHLAENLGVEDITSTE
jgi:hypothetical protein